MKKVNTDRYRLTVFKSSKNISAQIIDDKNKKTLVSATSIKKNSKESNVDTCSNNLIHPSSSSRNKSTSLSPVEI